MVASLWESPGLRPSGEAPGDGRWAEGDMPREGRLPQGKPTATADMPSDGRLPKGEPEPPAAVGLQPAVVVKSSGIFRGACSAVPVPVPVPVPVAGCAAAGGRRSLSHASFGTSSSRHAGQLALIDLARSVIEA